MHSIENHPNFYILQCL